MSQIILDEIASAVDAKIAAGERLLASFITQQVCGAHLAGLAENDHAALWRKGGYRWVRDETRRYISKCLGTDEADAKNNQSAFPGFEHVQSHYLVQREGEDVGVPALQLTDDEIEAKAALYKSMGAACFAHAGELVRFKDWRKSPTLAAAQ